MVRFVQFVFDMCFAHLRTTMRALFQDLNFQKWSETLNFFYTFDIFWLPNVLGQSADFLRGVAFWSIRSSGLLRWFCMTGAALRMTWHHFFVAGAILCKDTWTGTTTNYTTTPHYIQQLWARWPLHPLQKAQLRPPFGPSVDSLCHPCIATIHLSYSCLCWNFRHRLVRHYWYKSIHFHSVMHTV